MVCVYLGTIKGEKLNEPESYLSLICQKKKNSPNPAQMDSVCRAPLGPYGLAGFYCGLLKDSKASALKRREKEAGL